MTAKTHGQKGTRLYNIWRNMKARCHNSKNKDFKHYGGRGVVVCNEWAHDFAAFYQWAHANGYSDDLTIDRIDGNGNYCPNNCRWITIQEQQKNKRGNRHITYKNKTRNISEWAEIIGIDRKTLEYRVEKWGVEKAFCTPININRSNARKRNK